MPNLSRPVHSGTFLVTSVVAERRAIFQVERNAELFIEALQHYRSERRYLLHAFVLMPNHILCSADVCRMSRLTSGAKAPSLGSGDGTAEAVPRRDNGESKGKGIGKGKDKSSGKDEMARRPEAEGSG